VGAIGTAGAFSFQWSKNIACGEGGAMVTNDDRFYDLAWAHHNCGRLKSDLSAQATRMSWNLRMPAFQAGMLIPQIRRCPELFARRAANVAYLREKLAGFPGVQIQAVPGEGSKSAYHLLLCRLISAEFKGLTKARFLSAIAAEGIPFGGGYSPLYEARMLQRNESGKSPAEQHTGLTIPPAEGSCPVCARLCAEEAFWAGQRVLLGTQRDMDDIADAIFKVYEHAGEIAGRIRGY
jgi:dTDP-4-amino-4,6-dideoxygalactose transaminase